MQRPDYGKAAICYGDLLPCYGILRDLTRRAVTGRKLSGPPRNIELGTAYRVAHGTLAVDWGQRLNSGSRLSEVCAHSEEYAAVGMASRTQSTRHTVPE